MPDRVERQFRADAPNCIWVADITYVPTWAGFVFLAVVLDVFSHRVVGWAMATHLRTELVLAALNMAIAQRRPDGVVHHSDSPSSCWTTAASPSCPLRKSTGRVATTTRIRGPATFTDAPATPRQSPPPATRR